MIDRRNRGVPTDSVFIAVGWPSLWLREFVERDSLNKKAVMIAVPEQKKYNFAACVGLSCCVWCEREEDAARTREIVDMVMTANPLRLFILNPVTGATEFVKVAGEVRAAA